MSTPNKTTVRLGMIALAAIGLASCDAAGAEGNVTQSPSTPPTVIIDAYEYTCDDIAPGGCGPTSSAIFEQYGHNLQAYVYSGTLGPFNGPSYSVMDVAYLGLIACSYQSVGEKETAFIDWVTTEDPETFGHFSGVELLPAWFTAGEVLCPAD